jgi:YD repeat-containing protein
MVFRHVWMAIAITAFLSVTAYGQPTELSIEYEYDDFGRLTRVEYSDGSYIEYTYDDQGNRTSYMSVGPGGPATGRVEYGGQYYETLAAAMAVVMPGGVIRTQAVSFSEDIVSDREVEFAIAGGFDETFTSRTGRSTLNGQVVMNSGTITFGDFVFDGQ